MITKGPQQGLKSDPHPSEHLKRRNVEKGDHLRVGRPSRNVPGRQYPGPGALVVLCGGRRVRGRHCVLVAHPRKLLQLCSAPGGHEVDRREVGCSAWEETGWVDALDVSLLSVHSRSLPPHPLCSTNIDQGLSPDGCPAS